MINYPSRARTNIDKLAFVHRAEELLRLEHNVQGARFRNGEITEEEWLRYKKEDFLPKSKEIGHQVSVMNKNLGNDKIHDFVERGKIQEKANISRKSNKWDSDI